MTTLQHLLGRREVERYCRRFPCHLNASGHDIFVSMNPIRPKTRPREMADALEVRRLQLDLDKSDPDSFRRSWRT